MRGYRVFVLNGSGHISSAQTFHAENDDAALEQCRATLDGHPVELWQEDRLIAQLSPEDRTKNNKMMHFDQE